jgi:transposase
MKAEEISPSYKEYLIKRWNEGCRNAQLLYREIKAQGYTGSDTAVGRFIAPWRALKGEARSFKSVQPTPATMINPAEGKKKHPPTALQVAHWVTFKEDQRLTWQKDYLSRLCEADGEIQETSDLIQEFTTILRERKGEQFDSWLARVEQQGVAELQSFAQGLRKDYDAVKNGLTSNDLFGRHHLESSEVRETHYHTAKCRLFRINLRKNTICLPILLSPSFSVSHPEDWTGSAFRAPRCRILFP